MTDIPAPADPERLPTACPACGRPLLQCLMYPCPSYGTFRTHRREPA